MLEATVKYVVTSTLEYEVLRHTMARCEVPGFLQRMDMVIVKSFTVEPLVSTPSKAQLDSLRNWRRIPAYPIYEMTMEGDVRVVDTHEIPEKFLVDPSDTNLACYLLTLWDGRTVVKSVLSLMNETFPELGGLKNG